MGFELMTDGLVGELRAAFSAASYASVSFVGHSLGCIIIRSALARPDVRALFSSSHDGSDSRQEGHDQGGHK